MSSVIEVRLGVEVNNEIISLELIFTNGYTDITVYSFDSDHFVDSYKINRYVSQQKHCEVFNEVFAGILENFE